MTDMSESPRSFSQLYGDMPEKFLDPARHVLSNSVWKLMVSSVAWITVVQMVRSERCEDSKPADLLDPGFWTVISIDIVCTLASYIIMLWRREDFATKSNLGNIGARWLFPTVIGTVAVLVVWWLRSLWQGHHLDWSAVLLAFVFCAVTYAVILGLRVFLFEWGPGFYDMSLFKQLRKSYLRIASDLTAALEARLKYFGRDRQPAERLTISTLAKLVTSERFEDRDREPVRFWENPKVAQALRSVRETPDDRPGRRARRRLINKILSASRETGEREAADRALVLPAPFDEASSRLAHELLQTRSCTRRLRLWIAVILDQAVSVGFFGGVALYYLTCRVF